MYTAFDTAMAIGVVGVLGTCVGGFIWVIKFMFGKLVPAIDALTEASENTTKSSNANVRATQAATAYLKLRNGRDAEFQKENVTAIRAIPQQIIDSATITAKILAEEVHARAVAVEKVKTDLEETAASPPNQAVKTQTVETQIVNGNH